MRMRGYEPHFMMQGQVKEVEKRILTRKRMRRSPTRATVQGRQRRQIAALNHPSVMEECLIHNWLKWQLKRSGRDTACKTPVAVASGSAVDPGEMPRVS
jgi:hypothetical protein